MVRFNASIALNRLGQVCQFFNFASAAFMIICWRTERAKSVPSAGFTAHEWRDGDRVCSRPLWDVQPGGRNRFCAFGAPADYHESCAGEVEGLAYLAQSV